MNLYYALGALVLALLVAVVVAGLKGGAAERKWTAGDSADPTDRQHLLLARLADLEFEYQTGKIGEEEYRELKTPLARAAIQVRAELEGAGSPGEGDRSGERHPAQ